MAYTIPSDAHIASDSGHVGDHNNIADMLTLTSQVNVKNTAYSGGAAGNGSADDTTALQAAGTAGGLITLPPGTYLISQTLQFGSNTVIQGAGMGLTTIKVKNSTFNSFTQVGTNGGGVMLCTTGNNAASKITVRDLTLDMNEANNTTKPAFATAALCAPVGFQNVTGLIIERVEVINAVGYAVFPLACTDVRISKCRILTGQANNGYSNQDGIHVTDCTGVTIDSCFIDAGIAANGGDDAIAVQGVSGGCADVTITGCVIERAGAHGITLVLGGDRVTDVTISGNVIKATVNEAILAPFYTTFVSSGTYLLTDVTITGNVMKTIATGNAASGITLQDAFGGTGTHVGTAGYAAISICGNVLDGFTNSSGFGIYAQAGSDLTISDNTFRNWGGVRGIDIGDNSSATSRTVTNAVVSGNTVDMSGTGATSPAGIVVVDSPNIVVTDNSVIGPGTGVAGGVGISLLSIGTSIAGAVVNDNRSRAWATGISETNNGVAPNFNVYAGNNLHGCTAFLSTVGASDVSGTNVVA